MICEKCGKIYDSSWKICLTCNIPLKSEINKENAETNLLTLYNPSVRSQKNTVNVHFYKIKEARNKEDLVNLLTEKTARTKDSVNRLLLNYDSMIFRDVDIVDAVLLIKEFAKVGTIGAINGLANEAYYIKQFKKFYSKDGKFTFTWNWAAMFFNWLWQLFRGLWAKWLVYTLMLYLLYISTYMLIGMIPNLSPYFSLGLLIFIGVGGYIFYGLVGNYDYFLKKTRDENLWPIFPYAKFKAAVWGLIIVSVAAVVTWYVVNIINMVNFANQMNNPTISKGEALSIGGIQFQPDSGWGVVKTRGFPPMPVNFHREGYFLKVYLSQPGNEATRYVGSIEMLITNPIKGRKLISIDQQEVKNIVKPYIAETYPFGPLGSFIAVSNYSYDKVTINSRQWVKMHKTFKEGPKMKVSPAEVDVYYTISNNQVLILLGSGKGMDKETEKFITTFKFNDKLL